jgi:hypothetical protein
MNPRVLNINAVAFQKDGMWIAHCLEFSLVSYAETLEALPEELLLQVMAQVETDIEAGREPFHGFKRAPQRYWDLFEAAQAISTVPIRPKKSLGLRWRELVERAKIETQLFPVAAVPA